MTRTHRAILRRARKERLASLHLGRVSPRVHRLALLSVSQGIQKALRRVLYLDREKDGSALTPPKAIQRLTQAIGKAGKQKAKRQTPTSVASQHVLPVVSNLAPR